MPSTPRNPFQSEARGVGGHFAQDPYMPWTKEMLSLAQKVRSQAERMSQLRSAAPNYLRDTCEPNGAP